MAPSVLQPGFRVGRYELLAPIARGGMAAVWAARLQGPRGFEKLVAVKTILPHLADDPRFETMFLDEARIAADIVHPNVAQVFDLGEQDGVLYLVCEWVEGEPLSTLRRAVAKTGDRIPIPIVLRIMADVCAGLHAAHELCDAKGRPLEVVHRDVSPSNIVISDAGAVKVIDFGVAKAINRVRGETVAGNLKGKVHYMAPEQARGARVDRRADIWGVGAVLYQLLSGRLPYQASSPLAVLDLVAARERPPPLPADIPGPVVDLVERAMRLDPEERFPTAAEMQLAMVMVLRSLSMPVTNAAVADYVLRHLSPQADHRRRIVKDAIALADGAPAVDSDMTLVEYVTQFEGLPAGAGSSSSGSHAEESPAYAPAIVERSEPDDGSDEPEPVPLVRRSKPDWGRSDPGVERQLAELRSLVQHTMPPSVVPPPLAPPKSAAPTRSRRMPLALILAGVVVLAGVTVALATPVLRDGAALSGVAGAASLAAIPSAPPVPVRSDPQPRPVAPPVSASAVASALPPAPVAPGSSNAATSEEIVPPREYGGARVVTTVPPPPPGWESLPSVTLDPEGAD